MAKLIENSFRIESCLLESVPTDIADRIAGLIEQEPLASKTPQWTITALRFPGNAGDLLLPRLFAES